jgi:hypothetical protein
MSKIFAQKSMSIGSRIFIVVLITIAIIFGTLKLAERSNNALRLGLQDFLSQALMADAEITTLEQSKLVPEIIFHAKGINIRDKEDGERMLASADQAYIAIDFWRSFIGSGRFNGLEVRDLEIASGFLFPRKTSIKFLGISDPPPQTISPVMLMTGEYNKKELMVTLELRRHGSPVFKYDFGKVVPMTFKLGDLEASGFMERKFDSVGFEKITLRRGNHQAVFSLNNMGEKPLNLNLEGMIDESIPFTAQVSEKDDVKTMLVHVDEDKLQNATIFFNLISQDFGLEKDNDFFRIDVQSKPQDKEFVAQ